MKNTQVRPVRKGAIGASLFLVLIMALCVPLPAAAQDARVAVLGFEVHATGEYGYLQQEIPRQIKERLDQEGILARLGLEGLAPGESPQGISPAELGEMAVKNGVEFLIWGSFSLFGDAYSLDARLLAPGADQPEPFFAEGQGMETLLGSVAGLSRDLAARMMGRVKVTGIKVTGNNRIEADAIRRVIKTREGEMFSQEAVTRDIRAIFNMGYFEDIRVESEPAPGGVALVYQIREKSTIRHIEFHGNRAFNSDEVRAALDFSRGSVVNAFKVAASVKKIEDLYREKSYHNVRVTYEIVPGEENLADVVFNIEEGSKVRIREIRFVGNRAMPDKKFKKVMKSKKKGFWSWITQSGNLNREDLDQDALRISSFYQNNGYIDAKVSDPEVDIRADGIYVVFKIEEGSQYKVGRVDVAGDQVKPREELLALLTIQPGEIFSREVVHRDQTRLTDLASNEGYAYAEVIPSTSRDKENLVVDITYTINKGLQVYFERVLITGNTRTRDKVIRRELPVQEKGLYSGSAMKRGVQNLTRLDYFEDIQVETLPGSEPDQMVLKLNVKEKPTGAFTFGGGYSNIDNAFFMATVAQRNLFGRGQTLDLKGQIGGSSSQYSLSFTEPWFMDTRLTVGLDVYDQSKDYDTYDKNSRGGRIRMGYPILDYTGLYWSYGYDITNIRNINTDASDSIKDMEGDNAASKASLSLIRNTRNRFFNPSRGSYNRASMEYSGGALGGDIAFVKYTGESGWYLPLFWGTVGFLHGEAGYVRGHSGGILPEYERFYLGGIDSLRGFEWRDLSPMDTDRALIGGNKFVQFNVEFIFPIIESAGLVGLAFYDTGDEYDNHENVDFGALRESAGFGFRWYSPIGPIRLERGYILDPQGNEPTNGRWEFSMGAAF
ncbi:MAG: outer membrane protein assembly factor BamA [Pseudomonadota bacterium]